MLSFLLPSDIQVSCTSKYIMIKHKNGEFIKKVDKEVQFDILKTSEGDRLFASAIPNIKASCALSHRYNLIFGLSCGYQQRLRLLGIGFRARVNAVPNSNETTYINIIDKAKLNTKSYIRDRFDLKPNKICKFISIKLGYSHEVTYPIKEDIDFNVSAIDGRTKGRIINLKSNNYVKLNIAAAEIRTFRYPDAYKGKGIYYNIEKLNLKKGKRQG